MQSLDLVNVSLTGRKLIESSAGTGKTYAIASLYVRLLLERLLPVGQILVMTFTEAATEDLKRRIRERIQEAAEAFATGQGKDDFLNGLLRKMEGWEEAHQILSGALHALDEAAIFTIHGFCQRVLQDNAFESASLFDTEFITNQEQLLREIVDDFWRIETYQASPLFIRHVWQKGVTPESLLKFVKQGLAWPLLEVIPKAERPNAGELETRENSLWKEYQTLGTAWKESRAQVSQLLLTYDGLKRGTYSLNTVEKDLRELDAYFSSGNPLNFPAGLERLRSSKLASSLKKNYSPLQHPVFDRCEDFAKACEELEAAFERCLLALKVELAGFVRQELRARKQQQHLRSFDDLLLDLHQVLEGRGRQALVKSLSERYPAALIDEFQDTDPLQYAIFQSIYSGDETAVFLIGDPKQAIYSFRGADVFAYMQAARDVRERFTLDKNWRSSEKLVQAVSRIFRNVRDPFVFPEIEFYGVQAGRSDTASEFSWQGEAAPAPLKLWFMRRPQPGGPITKKAANELLPVTVASEIVRWLRAGANGKALVKGKPLAPHHIAVLVRTNDEAQYMHDALQQVGVPSVIHSDESVFRSLEALELQRLFSAIAEPGNEGKIRAALATELLGVNGLELARVAEDELAWDRWLQTFVLYRDLWINEGFMTMAAALITRQQVRSRLLALPDGERRLTNLLHCCELLHQAALENGLGVEELVKWLGQARQESGTVRAEEHQIRLETDEQAVRIVTVHKSKGLQYPIVFCPFCWNTGARMGESVMFHDARKPAKLVLDAGSEDLEANRRLAAKEALAENLRLLYVALTRAEYRCVVVWGAFRDAGASALAYLLHQPQQLEPASLVESLKEHFEGRSDEDLQSDLKRLAGDGSEGIESLPAPGPSPSPETYAPPAGQALQLACRALRRDIPKGWGVASFSSLIAGKARDAELPDRDALWERRAQDAEELKQASQTRTFFDFPRGRRAGTALHELFETVDFSLQPAEAARQLVREKLAQFGFEPLWQEPVWQMLRDVLSTPLELGDPGFSLSGVPQEKRLHELEFSFPLDLLTSKRLKAAFAVHRGLELPVTLPEALERLAFSPVQGAMKGFIDLIFEREGRFYLADWKSNFLGDELQTYAQPALREVMSRELYLLQYHLYVVALDRYLSFRIPGYEYSTHFGGVYYLFLRGMNPVHGPEYGVYRDRPAEALIRELSRCLSSTETRGRRE
ncbi:MAG: exodeoxyribonuclease V subunit beta [Acidobacteria bacterium]|nr:exodeoxyribonuclease V subunit beta [Acidobacteriota bacterium]MCI0723080.1 exodeoxyribonuclease V subunit beta [Acidobacteriota bacterium]